MQVSEETGRWNFVDGSFKEDSVPVQACSENTSPKGLVQWI